MYYHVPDYVYPPPCPLNILMVTDRDGCYAPITGNRQQRSLNLLIDSLTRPSSLMNARIRKAHREPVTAGTVNGFAETAEEGFRSFRFRYTGAGERSLENFDEIWLFGILNTEQIVRNESGVDISSLADDEVNAINRFMSERRGGVLAMGDHFTFGTPLCGRIPRVRSMRRWLVGEVPTATDSTRLDTRIKPANVSQETFDAQTENQYEDDDVPQEIYPVIYGSASRFLPIEGYPHPLLCGPNGPIRVLPDHMHEGMCYVPRPLPEEFNGISPQVIAYGTNRAGSAAVPSFGLIGAYDGDDAGLGRIVVESTWHHFVYLNLQGFAASTNPTGMRHWQEIQAYYQNLALWLAPTEKRACLFENASWFARWHPRLDEELATFANPNTFELVHLGRAGFDVLGQWAPRCWVVQSLLIMISRLAPSPAMRLMIDPWYSGNKQQQQPRPDSLSLLNAELIYTAALGGMLHRMYKSFPSPSVNPKEIKLLRKTLPVMAQEGIYQGLKSIEPILASSIADLQNLQQLLPKDPILQRPQEQKAKSTRNKKR
ncbi:MAG: hypothetical protein ICV60_06520 [Pyrinomonadaceae bacterium]|nr:hypothetical protein [Pyrinomonadaceae bacterium]